LKQIGKVKLLRILKNINYIGYLGTTRIQEMERKMNTIAAIVNLEKKEVHREIRIVQ
jgi:hypothetical protein